MRSIFSAARSRQNFNNIGEKKKGESLESSNNTSDRQQFSFLCTLPVILNLFLRVPLFFHLVSWAASGSPAPERGPVHLRAAQADQQQPAADRPGHHQLPDVCLRRPGAGAQGPGQRAALRGHVPQLAAQRLRHVRRLSEHKQDERDSGID